MRKLLLLIIFLGTLSADILFNKIENLIGKDQFQIHNNLINILFKNSKIFYITDEKLDFYKVLQTLRENGLLQLKLKKPEPISIEFRTNIDPIKSLKILNETLRDLGYYYYFTKSTNFNKTSGELVWIIGFKAEYSIDPLILVKELKLKSCNILNIEKVNSNHWKYDIDVKFAKIKEVIKIDNNEKVVLQKPLRPYFIEVNNATSLQVISRKLNHWFPYIVFYDSHMNVLKSIKKDRVYKGYKLSVPRETMYIKITDLYTLINIKRGLSIIVK